MQRVGWGVIGTAMIARTRTIPAMKSAPHATLVGLASRGADKARQAADELGVPRSYGSYEELLADPDITAVYIPLPNHLHLEWATRALEAGKHVLCEKPLCLSTAEISELRAVRDRTGLQVEEAFVYRSHPQWRKLRELLDSGLIGQVRGAQATIALQFLDP